MTSFRNRAEDLINEDLETDENEAKKYKLNEAIAGVKEILEFNEKHQNKIGQVLKILTPQQMLSRLPISLTQIKAGNNSQKLKNEIRQLLYSLYRSKKLSKTIYKHLMNAIIQNENNIYEHFE